MRKVGLYHQRDAKRMQGQQPGKHFETSSEISSVVITAKCIGYRDFHKVRRELTLEQCSNQAASATHQRNLHDMTGQS